MVEPVAKSDHLEAVRKMQWLARVYPKLRELSDEAITALIIQGDKLRKYEADK